MFNHLATKVNPIIKSIKTKTISQSNILAKQQMCFRETKRDKRRKETTNSLISESTRATLTLNFQYFKKTIKFEFRWSYIKKDHLNSKVFNSQQINFHLLLACWHSSVVVFLLSTTSNCSNVFSFYWLKQKLREVVMNSHPTFKSSRFNEIIFH